ncbi:MAG: diaminopimelate epimerase [Candidatus Azobacteroides sp.]|nr:diaminopimelate epimerase [Candidatus Azobacteroides sp.]
MKFVKMHGTGNDYVYVNCFTEKVEKPEELVRFISDRHKGIGSDGLVLILPSDGCDFRMRMFNPDGSEAEMCGNASRCVGKFVFDYGLTDKTTLTLETKAGIKRLQLFPENGKVAGVCVDMGEPVLKSISIPVNLPVDEVIDYLVSFGEDTYRITCVSMGNPHTVIFTEDIDDLEIESTGKRIEQDVLFPERTNVEFVKILSSRQAKMRVWERGTGETQACGTGACAALTAGVLNGLLDEKAVISLPGGDLEIEWNRENNHIFMTGNAVTVFEGEVEVKS